MLVEVLPAALELVADKADPVEIHPHGELLILLLHLPVTGALLGERLMVKSQGEHDIRPDLPGVQRPVETPQLYRVIAVEEAVEIEEMVAAVVVVACCGCPDSPRTKCSRSAKVLGLTRFIRSTR